MDPLEVDEGSQDPVGGLDPEGLRLGDLNDVLELMEQLQDERRGEDSRGIPRNRRRPARCAYETACVLCSQRHADLLTRKMLLGAALLAAALLAGHRAPRPDRSAAYTHVRAASIRRAESSIEGYGIAGL